MSTKAETQFSIYKIDYEQVKQYHENILFDENNPGYAKIIRDFLLDVIRNVIEKEKNGEVNCVEKGNFKGLIYKTYHKPEWKGVAQELLNNELAFSKANNDWLSNVNVSYVLFALCDGDIYAMTGGYGSTVVKNYIEKNWGLYLIPKFITKDNGIIRQIKENHMFGNTASMNKANRKTTDISFEQGMSTIFRELSVEIERDLGKELGIAYDVSDSINKKTGVVWKDSVLIRKNHTLEELETIINKLKEIEKRENRFALSYFIPINKKGIKSDVIFDKLIEVLQEEKIDDFQLVGDDYLDYYMIGSEYVLYDENGDISYSSQEPITLEQCFEYFKRDEIKITKKFITTFLKKWKICVFDSNSNGKIILPKMQIFEAMQGYVEYGENNIPYYLFQGKWYCMDDKYTCTLEKEFNDYYDKNNESNNLIKDTFGLLKHENSEDGYNKSFLDDSNYIVAHKALINNFEIADLIFWNGEYIFFMCNKGTFDGHGSRDLNNQIYASAMYFQSQMQSQKNVFLKKWYSAISNMYTTNTKILNISEEDFCILFENRKIKYIAGYIDGYRKNANSLYAKFLTIDLDRKMKERGFLCTSMNIR